MPAPTPSLAALSALQPLSELLSSLAKHLARGATISRRADFKPGDEIFTRLDDGSWAANIQIVYPRAEASVGEPSYLDPQGEIVPFPTKPGQPRWDVKFVEGEGLQPAGWEPFAVTGQLIALRRRVQ